MCGGFISVLINERLVMEDEDYRHAMNELTGFSFTTKKLHDDAPDSLAMLADYLGNGIKNVSVARRPF